jgi:hypothetical protein
MTANIGLALAIIVALFPLALFGILGLAGVVLVHEIAEVVVILNGVRAARRPLRYGNSPRCPLASPNPPTPDHRPSPRGGRTPPDLEPALVKTPIKATFATVAVVIVLVDRLAAPDPPALSALPCSGEPGSEWV